MKNNALRPARAVALVGILSASIFCVKLALSFLPNVEAVTLLTALFGYCFGYAGVIAAVVFVCIDAMIYGFGSWVISYFLYWPVVAAIFALFARLKIGGRIIPTVTAVLLTVWFGVLTSLVEVGLFSGYFDKFLYRFAIYYARGAVFYIVQTVCNAVLFPLLFPFLSALLCRLAEKRY